MGGKTTTIANSEQRILSLQVQQSSQGLTLPVVYGRARVPGNLIFYGDFTAIEHRTEQRSGKGGGGVKQVDTAYTYEAAVMMALCEGPVSGVRTVWRDKEKLPSPAQLRLNVYRGGRDQAVWPHLNQAKHAGKALNYSSTAYVCSPNYELTKSAQVHNHNFEVDGKLAYSRDIPDAEPSAVLADLLTNEEYGCGFPAESLGDLGVYSAYCRANGLFLSPVYSEQAEAHEHISALLEQTNSAGVFSEGRLKIIPYGDAPVSGNGAFYVPDLTPLYDLTDDDFIGGGEDPVRAERKTNADAFNQVEVEFLDRANDYNIAVVQAKDQANIEKFGLRPKEAVQIHGICDRRVAQQVAQLLLQRALYVRNEYEFKLGWKYVLLEPMDLLTLTDKTLGLDKTPVRIIEIEEDEEGMLTVRAEDFPFGTASAAQYPTQESSGYSADYNTAPGNAYAPAVFEAPLQLTGGEAQVWLATGGGENWGGAEVWLSADGDSYEWAGVINRKARYGTLQSRLQEGAAYDSANTFDVSLNAGQLKTVSADDARSGLTACWADGEFLSYQTAELTGVSSYRLSGLVRGLFGSDIGSHEAGSRFVRLDDALFKYPVGKERLGKTVWIKLVSFNIFGSGLQDIGEVPAYPYTIQGAPVGQVQNLRLTSDWAYGKAAAAAWDVVEGADGYDVEVHTADGRLLRGMYGLTNNAFTYSAADMKADGGQVREAVFKVRARSALGTNGAWTQLAVRNPQLKALRGITLEAGISQAFFRCDAPEEEDFAGIRIWLDDAPECEASDRNLAYDGRDTFVPLNRHRGQPLQPGKTYYVRAAGYDSFDKENLNIGSSVSFTVYGVGEIAKDLSESNLAAALKGRLNLIDGNGAGSVNARLQTAKQSAAEARQKAREAEAAAEAAFAEAQKSGQVADGLKTRYDELASELRAADGAATRARLDGLEQSLTDGTHALARKVGTLESDVNAAGSGLKAKIRHLEQTRAAKSEVANLARQTLSSEWQRAADAAKNQAVQTAAADAQQKADAARQAAERAAQSKADAAKEAAIADAQSKTADALNRAARDAQAKADAAKAAAERAAQSKADAAEIRALQAAARDAQAKADAAKREAVQTASRDAQQKADAAKAQAIADAAAKDAEVARNAAADAQAKADAAKAEALAETAAAEQRVRAEIDTVKQTRITRSDAESLVGERLAASFQKPDTRNHNRNPSWYWEHYPRQTAREFKRAEVIGAAAGGFCSLETEVPWSDHTGGSIVQTAYGSDGTVKRRRSDVQARREGGRYRYTRDAWTAWTEVETAPGAQARADAAKAAAIADAQARVEEARRATERRTDARIGETSRALADAQRAQAAKNTEMESRLQGAEAAVRQVSETAAATDGKLSAMHTLQVAANGHIAGIGLHSEIAAGRPSSRIVFQADRIGFGSGSLTAFPFTVDAQAGRVGINGEMVVNGKAIIDRLTAGDIAGDKIRADSLDGNRLHAGSITAREIRAGSVTAERLAADAVEGRHITAGAELRSPVLEAGVMRGGRIDIGNGQFTVDGNGLMTANQGVFRGRIEAEDGYFRGTVYADRIEGDVLKMHRLEEVSTGHYRLVVPHQRLPVIVSLMPVVIEVPEGNARLIWKIDNRVLKTWTAEAQYRLYSNNPSNDHPLYRGEPMPVMMHIGGDRDLDIGSHTVEIFYERQNTYAVTWADPSVGKVVGGREHGGFYRASLPSAPILWIGRA